MKPMIKLALTLSLYTVVACVALAFVFNLTDPLIKEAAEKEVKSALLAIYPEAKRFDDVSATLHSGDQKISFDGVYIAQGESKPLGIVVKASGPTYGEATLMVAVEPDMSIKTIKILSLTDTPGLGTKVGNPSFLDQFAKKPTSDAFKVGKEGSDADIIAISGASISSKSFTKIVGLASTKAAAYFANNYGSAQ